MESAADTTTYKDPPSPNGNNNENDENGNDTGVAGVEDSKPKVNLDPNELYYDMTGEKHLVVFNHYEYHVNAGQERRHYTDEDVKALEETFTNIGFTVTTYHDEDRETIWNILMDMRAADYSAASCLCITILTHGYDKGMLLAYDKHYYLNDVVKLFEGHPTLAGKPKLFLIQACRGDKMDDGIKIQLDGEPKGNWFVIPSAADLLIMRSTVEDYISWCDGRGSWMIQELCKAIKKYREVLDILQIITTVHKKVAFAHASYVKEDYEKCYKRQMIETTFTLTKFLKF